MSGPRDHRDHRGQPSAPPPTDRPDQPPPVAPPPGGEVRDHRGQPPAPPATDQPAPVAPPPVGGQVRDHRGEEPLRPPPEHDQQPGWGEGAVVRDHRSSGVKHIFVLMLENRSFDHMLGFSGITGTDARTGEPASIDGLTGSESNEFDGQTFTVTTGAADVMGSGPGHTFKAVLEQLTGGTTYPSGGPYPAITNSGYATNYAKAGGRSAAGDAMKCFAREELPVLTALAEQFVVCDRWFGSMPGPTEPNRMFAHAATSGFFDDSPTNTEIVETLFTPGGGIEFNNGTIFDRLREADVPYAIYADDSTPNVAELHGVSINSIEEFEDFAEDLHESDFDARYVFVEPSYDALGSFEDGNSQHPSGSVASGERFLKATYEAIRNSPLWDTSLLIITWDEHGGFYDHVVPPKAHPTGSKGRKYGFVFDQLGPRVPAVVVSPLIPRNLIEHRLFDHASIPATVERVFRTGTLNGRDNFVNGVNHLVSLTAARTDAPTTLQGPALARMAPRPALADAVAKHPDALVADDPHGNIAAVISSATAQRLKVTPESEWPAIKARAEQLQTHEDVLEYVKETKVIVDGAKGGSPLRRLRPDRIVIPTGMG